MWHGQVCTVEDHSLPVMTGDKQLERHWVTGSGEHGPNEELQDNGEGQGWFQELLSYLRKGPEGWVWFPSRKGPFHRCLCAPCHPVKYRQDQSSLMVSKPMRSHARETNFMRH
jgi:hypothetical protein